MIRFCDLEVCSIDYDNLERHMLLNYFLNGHTDDIICVTDKNNGGGGYLGIITYRSLLQSPDVYRAISRECAILDQNIWGNVRNYFASRKEELGDFALFPIIDKDRKLVCFAYQDTDANRELRMLQELQENTAALHFKDIFPQYECVKIYGFHELAYFFAIYLKEQGIPVQVNGFMWEGFFESDNQEFLDYACFSIYAEGIEVKSEDWYTNLLRSVSVEFECIDQIYEENIKSGIIRDADGSCDTLIKHLEMAKDIAILGTDIFAQITYNFLSKKGLDICCFVDNRYEKLNARLLGKQILGEFGVRAKYPDAMILECQSKGSAWGLGKTDDYNYLGLRRNKSFFLVRDYIELNDDGLKDVLKNRDIILVGDIYLCGKLANFLSNYNIRQDQQISYMNLPGDLAYMSETESDGKLKVVNIEDQNTEVLCLIVVAEYMSEWKTQIISYLFSHGFYNFTDYFSYTSAFINIESKIENKYLHDSMKPARIALGSIEACSGNIFFRELLDGHPSVLAIDYNFLNNYLFWYCVRLSDKYSDEIISSVYQLFYVEKKEEELKNINLLPEYMEQILIKNHRYTSQELFVIFHVAYANLMHREISDVSNFIIYWEPHGIKRNVVEEFTKWLGTEEISCDIINMVRNICMIHGSGIKGMLELNWPDKVHISERTMAYPDIDKLDYKNSKRIIIRFEDMKCNPKKELQQMCIELEIPWSETLMETTIHGKQSSYHNGRKEVTGFDLEPVYNLYEEYFSEFDRFRISLICAPYQKKYGYPYIDIRLFSKRELQELFMKEFRYMSALTFDQARTKVIYHIRLQKYIREKLQIVRMLTLM